LLSKGLPNASPVVAMAAGRGSLYDAKHVAYMHKIATGSDAAGTLNIEDPLAANLQRVARAKRMRVSNLTVVILDRPRHEDLIKEVRETGARIKLISDGDRVIGIDDLVRSDDVFFAATGVTDGEVLQGVKYHMNWAETESLVTRSRSGTLRRIYARHHWGYKQREWLGQPEEG